MEAKVPAKHDIFFHPKTGNTYRILGTDGLCADTSTTGYIYYENVDTGKCYHRQLKTWMAPREDGSVRYVYVKKASGY